jgi:DNA (cytosine-5)-methyltransferase 1
VLAFYAIYQVMIGELERFKGKELKSLEEHSAADSQTGATGDIEVIISETGEVFEALEIKHSIQPNIGIIQDVRRKIMAKAVDRYYVLTTHERNAKASDCQHPADVWLSNYRQRCTFNIEVLSSPSV